MRRDPPRRTYRFTPERITPRPEPDQHPSTRRKPRPAAHTPHPPARPNPRRKRPGCYRVGVGGRWPGGPLLACWCAWPGWPVPVLPAVGGPDDGSALIRAEIGGGAAGGAGLGVGPTDL